MKKITILIAVFFFSISVFAQHKDTLLGKYRWTTPLVMTEYSIDGGVLEKKVLSRSSQKFYVISTIDSVHLIIQIMKYNITGKKFPYNYIKYNVNNNAIKLSDNKNLTDATQIKKYNKLLKKEIENNKYFTVKLSEIDNYAEKYSVYSYSLALGVLNFPFKFRPDFNGNFDFAGSFNLGAAIGFTLPHYSYSRFKYSFLSGYSVSNIKLSPATTLGKNISNLDSINSFSALSISGGIMLEYNKIQAGLFVGVDYLSKDIQDYYKWIYNAKPWFSIGFGYAIFSKSEKIAKQTKQKNK